MIVAFYAGGNEPNGFRRFHLQRLLPMYLFFYFTSWWSAPEDVGINTRWKITTRDRNHASDLISVFTFKPKKSS